MVYNEEEAYIPVGRLDIPLSNEKTVIECLSNVELADETKEYIIGLYSKYKESDDNSSMVVTVFSPDLLPKTRTTITEYYTYNGMRMKTEAVHLSSISTPYRLDEQGSHVLNLSNSISSILVSVAGYFSTSVGLGGSLLSFFEALAGDVEYATANDFVQLRIVYDDVKQYTYGERYDGWYLGCITEHVHIATVEEFQHFLVNDVGTSKRTYQYPKANIKSPDYSNPWAKAYANLLNPEAQYVSYTIRGNTWYF